MRNLWAYFGAEIKGPLNNLSRCLKSHLSIWKLFSTNQTICIQKYNLRSNMHRKCVKMLYSPFWNTIVEGNKYWKRHVEIQKLILIDFTDRLNGGIKKGSIDAILLSIEMIEKGFCTNMISSRKLTQGFASAGLIYKIIQICVYCWKLRICWNPSLTQLFVCRALSRFSEVAQPLHLSSRRIYFRFVHH